MIFVFFQVDIKYDDCYTRKLSNPTAILLKYFTVTEKGFKRITVNASLV